MKKKDHSKRFKEFLEELAAGKEDIELIKEFEDLRLDPDTRKEFIEFLKDIKNYDVETEATKEFIYHKYNKLAKDAPNVNRISFFLYLKKRHSDIFNGMMQLKAESIYIVQLMIDAWNFSMRVIGQLQEEREKRRN